jgi:ABC-type long-subunit fatty acid transport system fused permease/ATPase subunit
VLSAFVWSLVGVVFWNAVGVGVLVALFGG